jgi:hypothetical protein
VRSRSATAGHLKRALFRRQVIVGRRANCYRATAVRKRDIRTALKGIDTALKALEMFAKLSGQLQGPQHNHLHLHAEVPSREEAIEAARECLEVFAPHLLAAQAVNVDGPAQPEEEARLRDRVVERRPDGDFKYMDPISHKYTGKPFPFRSPEGMVALETGSNLPLRA